MNVMTTKQKFFSAVFITVTILNLRFQMISCSTTFVASFQRNGGLSTKEWIEFNKPIPTLQEFTACHWEKIRFMSSDLMSIWAYCIAERKQFDNMNCTQLYSKKTPETNFQQLTFTAEINKYQVRTFFNLDRYQHRTWNHICWSYSSIKKMNKFYHNGNFIATEPLIEAPIIPSGNDFQVTSIILGQEPDSFNGKFSLTQLFNGELSEMNLWDAVLSDEEISSIGRCQKVVDGNILAWKREPFKNHNVHIDINFAMDNFCKEEDKYLVFPKRVTLHMAKNFCHAHGGQLAAPQSPNENNDIMNILDKHKNVCDENEPENPDNFGKVAWLGFERQKSEWYMINTRGQKENSKYANWKSEQIVYKGGFKSFCTFANSEGQWDIEAEDACDSLQLCAICVMKGNPLMNLNGLCSQARFDFNYYIATNKDHTLTTTKAIKYQTLSRVMVPGCSFPKVAKKQMQVLSGAQGGEIWMLFLSEEWIGMCMSLYVE